MTESTDKIPQVHTLLEGSAKDVLAQLFLQGPTWDGNLVSKAGRDRLNELGLITRYEGWQWLNSVGVKTALDIDCKDWADKRLYRKQNHQ